MERYEWLKRIARFTPSCPACGQPDWVPTIPEPPRLLLDPNSPTGHPELPGGFDGKAVLPVTCKHCGYVATYSIEHLQKASPWNV